MTETREEAWREAVQRQVDGLRDWLSENAPYCDVDQKHLDGGTVEQAYWHYGRLIALRDVLRVSEAARDPEVARLREALEKADAAVLVALDCVNEHEPHTTTKARDACRAAFDTIRSALTDKTRENKEDE